MFTMRKVRLYGSVNSKRALPPPSSPPGQLSGSCRFVLEELQMPHNGTGRSYKTVADPVASDVTLV